LFEGVTSRSEVVVTFLALLELIRLKQLTATQREPFGEIEVARALLAARTSEATAAAESGPPSPSLVSS
jgi:segregation and condensation protein A